MKRQPEAPHSWETPTESITRSQDEAYDLDPVGDRFKGGPIANVLIALAENERERLTIILAGYGDDLNKKLFAYNQV